MLPNTHFLDEITAVATTHEIMQPSLEYLYWQVTQAESATHLALDTTSSTPKRWVSDRGLIAQEEDEPHELLVPYDPNVLLPFQSPASHAPLEQLSADGVSRTPPATSSSNQSHTQTGSVDPTPSCSYPVTDQTAPLIQNTSSSDQSNDSTEHSSSVDSHPAPSKTDVETDEFTCRICGFDGRSRRRYRYHLLQRHSVGLDYKPQLKKQLRCINCPFTTDRVDTLRRHSRIHMTKEQRKLFNKYHCPFCDYKSDRSDHLKKHVKTHNK
ncbi:C2H2-type zinc finger protein [Kistimonas asteriae]|uniref:C2H2-type zinc finger protein n=1 Tax=Kistimonas asteriae TaxID=517724 RepID=UPI001BA5996C|nr:C2H2-type zinc finger protein [Kistimonas asteriae]